MTCIRLQPSTGQMCRHRRGDGKGQAREATLSRDDGRCASPRAYLCIVSNANLSRDSSSYLLEFISWPGRARLSRSQPSFRSLSRQNRQSLGRGARPDLLSLVDGLFERRDDLLRVFRSKDGRPRDNDVGACVGAGLDGGRGDAAVDLNVYRWETRAEFRDLRRR